MIVLIVLGILAIAAGVAYLVVPAHALPSFVPGHIAGSALKHRRRGLGGVILGVVLIVVGAVLGAVGGSPSTKPA